MSDSGRTWTLGTIPEKGANKRVNRRIYLKHANARVYVFDYIERFHNPRRRRRLETAKRDNLCLTQPSVEMV